MQMTFTPFEFYYICFLY